MCNKQAHFDAFFKSNNGIMIKVRVNVYVILVLPHLLLLSNDFLISYKVSLIVQKERIIFDITLDKDDKPIEVPIKIKVWRYYNKVPVRYRDKVIILVGLSVALPLRQLLITHGQDYNFDSNDSLLIPNSVILAQQSHLIYINYSITPVIIAKERVLGIVLSIL